MPVVSFYTLGPGFTDLMQSFLAEGRFKAVYETLEDGGLPHEKIVEFFYGQGKFVGDSRDDSLAYTAEKVELDQADRFYWMMRNFITNHKNPKFDSDNEIEEDDEKYYANYESPYLYPTVLDALTADAWSENIELQYLHKIITRSSLTELIWKRILKDEGFELNPITDPERSISGVLLATGDLVQCNYMEHDQLYPILYSLGKASSSHWTDDTWTFHISSGQVSGSGAHSLESDYTEKQATSEQIAALVKYKTHIKKMYGSWNNMFETLRDYYGRITNHGGKFNNLTFLRNCYPTLKMPQFSKTAFPSEYDVCLRTSPELSLPGLLHSKFKIESYDAAIEEMQATFDKYKDIREGNKFHYFYQEFIPGTNGVFHRTRDGFSYAIGDEQGDVVKGKIASKVLSPVVKKKLEVIADELFNDLDKSIQVEFVVDKNNEIYIVQLRLLANEAERTVISSPPKNIIIKGRTFSKGSLEGLTKDDVLVVDEDAESEALLGKKALIVKSHVEFSHILALSGALQIPSLYATGDITLPNGKFKLKAYNEDGYIYL